MKIILSNFQIHLMSKLGSIERNTVSQCGYATNVAVLNKKV